MEECPQNGFIVGLLTEFANLYAIHWSPHHLVSLCPRWFPFSLLPMILKRTLLLSTKSWALLKSMLRKISHGMCAIGNITQRVLKSHFFSLRRGKLKRPLNVVTVYFYLQSSSLVKVKAGLLLRITSSGFENFDSSSSESELFDFDFRILANTLPAQISTLEEYSQLFDIQVKIYDLDWWLTCSYQRWCSFNTSGPRIFELVVILRKPFDTILITITSEYFTMSCFWRMTWFGIYSSSILRNQFVPLKSFLVLFSGGSLLCSNPPQNRNFFYIWVAEWVGRKVLYFFSHPSQLILWQWGRSHLRASSWAFLVEISSSNLDVASSSTRRCYIRSSRERGVFAYFNPSRVPFEIH